MRSAGGEAGEGEEWEEGEAEGQGAGGHDSQCQPDNIIFYLFL